MPQRMKELCATVRLYYKRGMTDDNTNNNTLLLPPPGPLRAEMLWDMMVARGDKFFQAAVLQVTPEDVRAAYGMADISDTYCKDALAFLSTRYGELLQKFDQLKPGVLNNLKQTLEPLGVNDINSLSDALASLMMKLYVNDEKGTSAQIGKQIAERTIAKEYAWGMSAHTATARMLGRVVAKFGAGFPMDVAIRLAREPEPAPQSATILKLPVRSAAARRGVKPDGSFDPP